MKIRIDNDNLPQLAAEITRVNGRAARFTVTPAELIDYAAHAEAELDRLQIRKAERAHAAMTFLSGYKVPASYAYQRKVSTGTIVRGSTGWYLVQLHAVEVWPSAKPHRTMTLTAAQHRAAVERFTTHAVSEHGLFRLA